MFKDMFHVDEIKAELKRAVSELRKAEKERDILKSELEKAEKEQAVLKGLLAEVDKIEYFQLKQVNANLNAQKEKAKIELQQFDGWFAKRKQAANQQLIDLDKQVELKKKEVIILDDEILLQSFGFYKPHYDLQNSEQYKLRLDQIRAKQEWLVKMGKAVIFPTGVTLSGSLAEGEKMIKDYVRLILRSFNNECDASIVNVKFSNVKSIEKKIRKAYETLNILGKRMGISIVPEYLSAKLDELYLCYEYQAKKQDEKEEQKRIREQIREDAKLLKEIEEMKSKVEKEQKHFNKALENIIAQLERAQTNNERELLEKEKLSIIQKVDALEKDMKDVQNREQNTRAGYVYIISNIGAFGENVYKIGVTRRLDPEERVDELGDASVPFDFDIHAMVFSDDAPALENALHKAFEQKRLNMINRRREFFNVTLDEIETVVKTSFSKPVEFVKIADAAEYRESLILKKPMITQ
jgi:chromosome segregation ATPase